MTAPHAPRRLSPARMAPRDVVGVGAAGQRTRPTRALLSALGIAIGIAAMVAVVGISSSSREQLDRQLAALGTNLLTVSPGQTIEGQNAKLPAEAEAMIGRIGPVTAVSAVDHVTERYGNNRIEADHGRLKARLRPMRGLKRLATAAVIAAGHAFVQNIRRGHYELAVDVAPALRPMTAFTDLAQAI
jgi:hypothetical protein